MRMERTLGDANLVITEGKTFWKEEHSQGNRCKWGPVIRETSNAAALKAGSPEPASALSGNFLEMHILWAHPRPTKSETLRWDPVICVLISPPGNPDAGGSLGVTALRITSIPSSENKMWTHSASIL